MKVVLLFVILALCSLGESIKHGVMSKAILDIKCLQELGYQQSMVRASHLDGRVDEYYIENMKNCISAGMPCYDYLSPAAKAISARDQIKKLCQVKMNAGFQGSTLMIYIVSAMTKNTTLNQKYLGELISEAKSSPSCFSPEYPVGFITNKFHWEENFGKTFTGGNRYLMFAGPDGREDMNNFVKFGGWSTANAKQFLGSKYVCGSTVDLYFEKDSNMKKIGD